MINYRIDPRGKTVGQVKAKEAEVKRQWEELNKRAEKDERDKKYKMEHDAAEALRHKNGGSHDPYHE